MSEIAKVIEAAAAKEWRRIRQAERWIPNTEDVRGAFVAGFARGFQAGMTIDLKRIAESLVNEAGAHHATKAGCGDDPPRCPKCGYSYEDCQIHMDHHLCGEPTPPRKHA